MPRNDLTTDELRAYAPDLARPTDLDAFWAGTLAAGAAVPLDASFDPVDNGLRAVTSFDLTFRGADGDAVRGWLHVPADAVLRGERLPAVVQYQGYGGGRGLVQEDVFWATAGYAHLVMDTRGQGSGWSPGSTPDPAGSPPAHPGYLTRGIGDPHTYYYRRLFVDAARAVEAARAHPLVDATRVAVTGRSQGGALTIAAAALVPDVVAAMPDVPFLADFRRATDIATEDPYLEIVRYLAVHRDQVETVFRTLSYFDVAVLGREAVAPALFSVAHRDQICPPSTVYAAFHSYGGDKEMCDYEFNDHEGGEAFQRARQLRWLAEHV